MTFAHLSEKADFVVFLSQPWESFFRRHLLRAVARQFPACKMLCIERPLCLTTAPLRTPALWAKQFDKASRLRQVEENLTLYRPWILLHDHLAAKLPVVQAWNQRWVRRQIETIIKAQGLRRDQLVTWAFDPFQEGYLGLLDERLSIYDCYDEYTAYPELPFVRTRADVQARERRLLRRADVTLVVSEELYKSKGPLAQNIHLVPNGVDFDHFYRAHSGQVCLAEEMAGIPKPIVGYLGNLTDRIDFSLLIALAERHPDWQFVLIGGQSSSMKPENLARVAGLDAKHNVHLLGARPYPKLAHYLAAFDVCLIPYDVDDPFNVNCSPLKLYEYMATGKAIVSTDLPAVRPFDGLIRIARDVVEFERQIKAALQERDPDLVQRRLAVAKENTWERRVEQMLHILDQVLAHQDRDGGRKHASQRSIS